MARQPKNSGKSWSASDLKQLHTLVRAKTPARIIAKKMQRTQGAVYMKDRKFLFGAVNATDPLRTPC
jgi:hypothetical protein